MKQILAAKTRKSKQQSKNDIQLVYSKDKQTIMKQIQSAKRKGTENNNADAVRSVGPHQGQWLCRVIGSQMARRAGARSPQRGMPDSGFMGCNMLRHDLW